MSPQQTPAQPDDDSESTLMGVLLGSPQAPPAPAPALVKSSPIIAHPAKSAAAYRPTGRPSMAILTVFDDGLTEGESIRLRGDRFTIGRVAGDLLIPHDPGIAERHVEIVRRQEGGRDRWVVVDVSGDKGMLIRVSRAHLSHGSEILAGRTRLLFHIPDPASLATTDYVEGSPNVTLLPQLSIVGKTGEPTNYPLVHDLWIGSDPKCGVPVPDDPFLEPRHVQLRCVSDGRWLAQHEKTQNGLWLRVPEVVVGELCYFQIGEQRFRVKIP
jgi:hypothetical protein